MYKNTHYKGTTHHSIIQESVQCKNPHAYSPLFFDLTIFPKPKLALNSTP